MDIRNFLQKGALKRKASDAIEADTLSKEVCNERAEEIYYNDSSEDVCDERGDEDWNERGEEVGNESLHLNVEDLDDIGKLVDNNGRINTEKLVDQQKYNLLKTHFKPPKDFKFPLRQFGKQMCGVSCSCIRGSFVYSKVDDSIWCVSCALFAENSELKACESFVNVGFRNIINPLVHSSNVL